MHVFICITLYWGLTCVQTEYWNVVCMYLRVLEYLVEPHSLFWFMLQSQHSGAETMNPHEGLYSNISQIVWKIDQINCEVLGVFLVALIGNHFVLLCPLLSSLVHSLIIINIFISKVTQSFKTFRRNIFLGLGYDFGYKESCIHSLFCIVLWFHKIFPNFFIKSKI